VGDYLDVEVEVEVEVEVHETGGMRDSMVESSSGRDGVTMSQNESA
jgi:hypothetical protein